jgi:hypothetical protein
LGSEPIGSFAGSAILGNAKVLAQPSIRDGSANASAAAAKDESQQHGTGPGGGMLGEKHTAEPPS